MNEFLELEKQREISDLIAKNPGISSRKIAESLKMNLSLVERYLLMMEERREITAFQKGGIIKYTINYTINRRKLKPRERRTREIRNQIYDIIAKNPGIHLSKIGEMLGMSTQLAEYHLLNLEKNDKIIGVKEEGGYYKRYYIKESEVGTKEKRILSLLRQEHLLRVVILLLKYPNIRHKELLDNLDIAPSTLTHHLNRLVENDIADAITYGKEKGFFIKNEKEVIWMIRRYKLYVIIESFKDMWKDLNLMG